MKKWREAVALLCSDLLVKEQGRLLFCAITWQNKVTALCMKFEQNVVVGR